MVHAAEIFPDARVCVLFKNLSLSSIPEHTLILSTICRSEAVKPEFHVVATMQVENLLDVAQMYLKECVTFPESHSSLLLRYMTSLLSERNTTTSCSWCLIVVVQLNSVRRISPSLIYSCTVLHVINVVKSRNNHLQLWRTTPKKNVCTPSEFKLLENNMVVLSNHDHSLSWQGSRIFLHRGIITPNRPCSSRGWEAERGALGQGSLAWTVICVFPPLSGSWYMTIENALRLMFIIEPLV